MPVVDVFPREGERDGIKTLRTKEWRMPTSEPTLIKDTTLKVRPDRIYANLFSLYSLSEIISQADLFGISDVTKEY